MRSLILIGLVTLVAFMISGCVVVDAQYHYGHHPYSGVYISPMPPPPPVVIVRPYGPPHGHYYYGPAYRR